MKTLSTLVQIRPRDHERYRDIPIFGCLLDEFVPWAFDRGYTISTVYLQLDSVRHAADWFRRRGQRSFDTLTADDLRVVHRVFATQRRDPRYAWGLHGFVVFLLARGYIKPALQKRPSRSDHEVRNYLEYLRKDRGAADSTCDTYRRHAQEFLKFLGFEHSKKAIKGLTLKKVHRYFRSVSGRYQRKTMQHVVGSMRGFLRYQFMRGVLGKPLHEQIDTVRSYHDEHLPYPVRWDELQQVIQRIDRSTPLGLRDYAVLLLAATYGLRASDVANLTLEAVNWRERTIRIVQCKTRQPLTLPLTDEVGAALANYIRLARPTIACRKIFLRTHAPIAPMSMPGICHTLRRASRITGIALKAAGFRCLRHAVALRLLRQGASTKDIGDILGHRATTSTSTYLRLNVDDLRQVALPVPRNSQRLALPQTPTVVLPHRRAHGARMAPCGWIWRSCLGKVMADYVAVQRALGRKFEPHERTLRGLDFFMVRRYPRARKLTAAIFAAWAEGLRSLSPTTARMRMLYVRKLCRHVARSRSGTFIPDLKTFPKELPHQAPYLLSESEVARLLIATAKLRATRSNPLHPQTIRLAVLLTFCSGLRRGEILKLRIEDIDTEEMVLRIKETKFYKSRLVPISASVAKELRRYLSKRERTKMPMEASAPLVWNGWPRRHGQASALTGTPFWQTWRRICRFAQIVDHRGQLPRIHDLRHGFAVEVLRRGYASGQDAQSVLPRLARYMGHADAQFTHYYLKFTEPLRHAASDRFRRHLGVSVLSPAKPQKGCAL